MSVENDDLQRRRLKSGNGLANWLRNPRLLRWLIKVGILAYRLWQWWNSAPNGRDG